MNNLANEYKKLEQEKLDIQERLNEINKRQEEIDIELTDDILKDTWFYFTNSGVKTVFYSKESVDKLAAYQNTQFINGKIGAAYFTLKFRGYAFVCEDESESHLPRIKNTLSLKNYWCGEAEEQGIIKIGMHYQWGFKKINKKEACKIIAKFLSDSKGLFDDTCDDMGIKVNLNVEIEDGIK